MSLQGQLMAVGILAFAGLVIGCVVFLDWLGRRHDRKHAHR